MRKTILLATALCLASNAMAQSYGNPLSATIGNNTYQAPSESSIYWQFTADQDYIATISQLGDCEVPTISVKEQGASSATEIRGVTAADYVTKIYAFEKGKTYYFALESEKAGEVGFNLKLDKTENLGAGLKATSPLEIKLGETQFFGNPCYGADSWDDTNIYTTYKAEKDGQLRIKTDQYVNSATVNGTKISSEIENGKKVFKINTEAGKTYAINFSIGIPFFIATSEVVEVKQGSIDMPYALQEGENTIPAEAGKYYFTYTPSKKGYLNLTSSDKLTDGQVTIYRNKVNAAQETAAAGQSEKGSYDIRTEIISTYFTYYIVVDKKVATDKAETLTCQMEDYQAGETPETAIPVEVSDAASTITLPKAKGTYYYTIKVPANTNKLIVVESTTSLSKGSSAYLNTSTGSWGAATMENGVIKKDVSNSADKTYFLTVTSDEASPLTFRISYATIEKGALITNPKEAEAGTNTIDFDGVAYYTYKATKSGKLAIEVKDGVTVTFPLSATGYGENDTYVKGNVFFIQATKDKEYLITLSGVKKGSTFNLEETNFEAGELRSNPIVMTEDTYTLGEDTNNLWLKYKVTKTGVIDFSSDVPFNDNFFLGIVKNEARAAVSMAYDMQDVDNTTAGKPERVKLYQSTFEVKQGDVLYIQVVMPGDVKGKKLTLTQREAKAGETISNPIVLKQNQTIDVSKASLQKPIWVKATLAQGKNSFLVSDGVITPICNCRLTNDGISYEGETVAWSEDGKTFSTYSFSGNEDFVFMIGFAEGMAKLTYGTEMTDGITSIEAIPDSKPSIYTLDGTKINQITGNGVYIIKSNGKTKKVVIKK